jgi:signal transduction histidine kinase
MNALEAINHGGQITIRYTHRIESHQLVVEIADTGPGVPPELLPKIFDTFVTTKPEGSGLGLAICRAIADAHRAAIRAENNASGPGMKFVLEFPAQ